MFERTLQDLIRGLRAHKASSKAQEDAFLAEAMKELKEELRGKDMALKAEGVLKMCYLMMLYPIPAPAGFAFHVVEVMSSPRYHLKQMGYLAAPMAFSGDTEEVVLTVNGIKKDILSPHLALPPLPLTALPHLLSLSPSLSHTLHPDLLHLLTHSSPWIRKRAVLCLLPCWEAFPDGLREGFPRLRDRLLDDDQGVVGATVGVVMELARRQGGKNYLPLAPELFGILTASSNNWMLIKVVKLFAILTPLEPRLVRKLLPPLTALISSTSAISLLYECVRTCIVGGMLDPDREEGEALARVCVEKLGGYLRDEGGDQNLRYISLLAMVKIIPTHPHMVAEYQEEILQSLDDPDVSIRMRALELVTSMVDQENLQAVVDRLLNHLSPEEDQAQPSAISALAAIANSSIPTPTRTSLTPAYRLLLAQKLLSIIGQDTYVNVTDFEWVLSVLIDVAYVSRVNVASEIKSMILDIVGRVKSVRGYAVGLLEKVIGDEGFRERGQQGSGEDGLLEAAIWTCGEYSSHLSSSLTTISSLLSSSLSQSSSAIISLSLQATAKIFGGYLARISSTWSAENHNQSRNLVQSIIEGFQPFLIHPDLEVQERAVELSQLFNFVQTDIKNHVPPANAVASSSTSIPGLEGGFEEGQRDNPDYPKSLFLLQPLFTSHELNTTAYKAQESVRIPEGLNLDLDIVPNGGFGDMTDEIEEESEEEVHLGVGGGKGMDELRSILRDQEARGKKKKGKGRKKDGEVELSVEEKVERERRKAERRARNKEDPYYLGDKDEIDVDDIPIVKLDDLALTDDQPKPKKKTKPPPVIDRSGEMPENAVPPPSIDSSEKPPNGLAAVDLAHNGPVSSRSSVSKFEEYKDGDDEEQTPIAGGDIEVVRVKRKKKKAKPV